MKRVIITGPSGGGKSTLATFLKENGYKGLVTCTTRKPRDGEVDGVSYHFFDNKEDFLALEKIEYVEYSNNFYGLSVKEVEDNKNVDSVCVLEINGAKKYKELFPDAKLIFVYAPIKDLKIRMQKRGDKLENIESRLSNIEKLDEMGNSKYADKVILNDNLERAKKELLAYLNN